MTILLYATVHLCLHTISLLFNTFWKFNKFSLIHLLVNSSKISNVVMMHGFPLQNALGLFAITSCLFTPRPFFFRWHLISFLTMVTRLTGQGFHPPFLKCSLVFPILLILRMFQMRSHPPQVSNSAISTTSFFTVLFQTFK